MIVITAVMHPEGSAAGAYEVLHGTLTNIGTSGNNESQADSYAVHLLARPKKEAGIEGFEADVTVEGWNYSLGLAPLLGSVFYHVAPIPMEFEPDVRVDARLTLKELDEFDARLRGQA